MRWEKIIGWTVAILGILIVFGVVGGFFFLRTGSFQRMAIRTIVQDVNEATGGRAEIGSLDFQLSALTAHLCNITVHGTEAAGEPPLLQVDELTVGLKIQSVLQRKVTLSELAVEHPVARVRVDRNGKSNLPQAPRKQSGSSTSVFDLAVGHVGLSNGQVHYNDRSIPVDADLYGLKTEIRFEPIGTVYRGTISYDRAACATETIQRWRTGWRLGSAQAPRG